jgi:Tol biopolymer transport system component
VINRAITLALLLHAVTLVGCDGQQGLGTPSLPSIPSDRGVGARATFVLATQAGLLGAAADGQILGRIVDLPPGTTPSSVALHPDGKRIYFALTQTSAAAAQGVGFGSDIYSVNVDGTDLRPVIARTEPYVFYASPTFDAAGNLYVHRREGDLSATNPSAFQAVKDSIERLEAANGVPQRVLSDAADPSVTPDGTKIIYMKTDRGEITDLWIASTDGAKSSKFLKTDDWFSYLQAPRISPNGRLVMWSSVPPGRPTRPSFSPTAQPTRAAADTTVSAALTSGGASRLAHLDIPSQLFIAPIDGSSIRSVFLTSDDVVPSWSPDGTRIAFVLRNAFYIISATDGALIKMTPSIAVTYGDPVWLRSN